MIILEVHSHHRQRIVARHSLHVVDDPHLDAAGRTPRRPKFTITTFPLNWLIETGRFSKSVPRSSGGMPPTSGLAMHSTLHSAQVLAMTIDANLTIPERTSSVMPPNRR
jgi:hypothetical protein